MMAQSYKPDPTAHWASIGQIASVFGDSAMYRDLPLQIFFGKVLIATSLGQFAIAHKTLRVPDGQSAKRIKIPIAVILWAKVSDELDTKFMATNKLPVMQPDDWNSGHNFWIIEAVGPDAELAALANQLRTRQFGGNPYKLFVQEPDGAASAREVS